MPATDRLFIDIGPTEDDQGSTFANGTLQYDGTGKVAFTIQTEIEVPARIGRKGVDAVADYLDEVLGALVDAHEAVTFNVQVGPSNDADEEEDEDEEDEIDEDADDEDDR